MLPLLSPAHLDRDFDYLVPPKLDELAQPGVRVRVRFAGRLVDGYLIARLAHSDHTGKLVELDRVVSGERVLTPEILALATAVAARYAGTRADVLRLAIPPRHARTETGKTTEPGAAPKNSRARKKPTPPDQPLAVPPEIVVPEAGPPPDSDAESTEGPPVPVAAQNNSAEPPVIDSAQRAPSAASNTDSTSAPAEPSGVGDRTTATPADSADADDRVARTAEYGAAQSNSIDAAGARPVPTTAGSGVVVEEGKRPVGVAGGMAAVTTGSGDAVAVGSLPGQESTEYAAAQDSACSGGGPAVGAMGERSAPTTAEGAGGTGERSVSIAGATAETNAGVDPAGAGVLPGRESLDEAARVSGDEGPRSPGAGEVGDAAAGERAVDRAGLGETAGSVVDRADGTGSPGVRPVAVVDAGSAGRDSGPNSAGGEGDSAGGGSVGGEGGRSGPGAEGDSSFGGRARQAVSVIDAVLEEVGSQGDSRAAGAVVGFDTAAWGRYVHGAALLGALRQGRGARAAWQALPGEDWARRLAELAAVVAGSGRSAILMVPDQRDLDRVLAECVRLVGDSAVGLAAGLGPAARYRRWLAVLRGTARVVVGTRSAVFAPAANLGLIAIWDDGDDTYAEPRAPYPHAREVAMLRAHETGAAFVAAGFARTAEVQAVVESGWAHDLVADRAVIRQAAPRISAPGDSDYALERDPIAKAVRIPAVAFNAARSALKEGAPVLVQVPRRGYVPALACAKCRTPARCRHCNGPLALPEAAAAPGRSGDRPIAHSPSCRWCGKTEAAFRCPVCASRALRAVVIGAVRTAEELGRAFPGVPIRGSGGGAVLDAVEPGPQVVVATVGAEPVVPGGYGVALLLDGWALLSRADLRAGEDALRRWMTAATLVRPHGQVIVMAEPSIPTVQALVRWDPVGHAAAELAARAEVGFPPAVRMAALDGTTESIAELLSAAKLPDAVTVLGPVPLPPAARKPFTGDSPAEVERMLLRVPRRAGAALAQALTAAQAIRSTHRSDAPLRVQIDPVDIG